MAINREISPQTTLRFSLTTTVVIVSGIMGYTIIGYSWFEHRFAQIEQKAAIQESKLLNHDGQLSELKNMAGLARVEVLKTINDGFIDLKTELKGQRDKLDRVAEDVARQGGHVLSKP